MRHANIATTGTDAFPIIKDVFLRRLPGQKRCKSTFLPNEHSMDDWCAVAERGETLNQQVQINLEMI